MSFIPSALLLLAEIEFLNGSTVDVLGLIILCCCRMFSSIPGLYLQDATNTLFPQL